MSWRNIAEQYYVRITELEAEIARLREALDGALAADWSSLRETLARQEERTRIEVIIRNNTSREVGEALITIIRALSIPSPPAEETKT